MTLNKAILQALRGRGLKFINVTINFWLFYEKNVTKFAWLPNFESYLHAYVHGKIILKGVVFFTYQ